MARANGTRKTVSGWHDVDLTEGGGARESGRLQEAGFEFDVACFRAQTGNSYSVVRLTELDQVWIPVHREWRLNSVLRWLQPQ